MQDEQYRAFYDLIKAAFIEMQHLVSKGIEEHKYIFHHYDFPRSRGIRDNGMPEISKYYGLEGPNDYASLFNTDDDEHYYYCEKIPLFSKILQFVSDNIDDFKTHPYFNQLGMQANLTRIVKYDLLEAFDSYMHAANSLIFCGEAFDDVIFRLFNRFFEEKLQINICIPILLVRFENDITPVSENIQVRKLNERELISAYKIGGYSDTYELLLVSSATHVLELQNYSLQNVSAYSPFSLDYIESYPIDIIDKWFAAFRIITHCETGYGQILSFPCKWGVRKGNLIDVHGVKIQKFPVSFIKKRLDIMPTPMASSEEISNVIKLFSYFLETSANSLSIAIRRLNMAYLREAEEDSIIDLMIGIEALVTKEDYGEITYKVSTRVALVLTMLQQYPYSAKQTYNFMRQIYKFRSKVVHGETVSEKLRIVKLQEDVTISSVELARRILEYLLLAVADHAEFLDPNNIDSFFLSGYEERIKKDVGES